MLVDLMAGEMVCGCATLILRTDGRSAQCRKRGNGGSQDDAGPELLTALKSLTLHRLRSKGFLLCRASQRRDQYPYSTCLRDTSCLSKFLDGVRIHFRLLSQVRIEV
jgi:hypothetical protein